MVMEPNKTDENQLKSEYPHDIPAEYPQQNAQVDGSGKSQPVKPDSIDSNTKGFQQNSDVAAGNVHQQRQFSDQSYNDGNMQRPSMYADGAMPNSVEQPHYPQSGPNSAPLTANTPTLNQLLTQNPHPTHPPKYPNAGYGEYSSGAPTSSQTMYDGWNNPQQNSGAPMYANPMNQVRAGVPPNRAMHPNSMQMGGTIYDRPGQQMHQAYRHPNPQFGPPAGSSGYRMMGGPHHQGYPPHPVNAMESSQGGGAEANEMDSMHPNSAQQRVRPMMAPGRMMGPPRTPHQMDPSGQMMPPPNQSQGYPGMHPFGNQQYRNTQMPSYGNFPPNQPVSSQMSRSQPQASFPQGPINHQSMGSPQVNGPQHKSMPPSPVQPINQPSPASAMRGMSPAPNQQIGLAPSPASSTGQAKAVSPCPSPSVRSMPPSPASVAQINSPHPGMSPRPESVPSPRTDVLKPEQLSAPHPNSTQQPVNSQQSVNPGQQSVSAEQPAQAAGKPDQPMMAGHVQTPQQHMMPPQQSHMQQQLQQQQRMVPPTGVVPPQQMGGPLQQMGGPPQQMGGPPQQMGGPPQQMGGPHQQAPPMGNGMSPYQQRMPSHYQHVHRPAGPGYAGGAGPQYPPNHNQQMGASGYPPSNPALGQPGWAQQQQMMSSDMSRPPAPGGIFSGKNEKSAVPSPLSAAQSPAASSPHGSESGRRPSSRKSDGGGSTKSQKPVGANTVHGSSMDVFNRQVELGPETPMRRQFMDHLCAFYLENSKPLMVMPSIGKNPFDLYKVYMMVKEKGGFVQTCKKKQWKQIGISCSASTAANAAYTLKKAYIKYLLNYECKFERGGVDPQVLLTSVETKKDRQNRNAPSPGSSSNSQDAHMRGYTDYGVGPGVHPGHPAHMPGGQMRPNQPYHDPNMPQHQQHGYMNYNNMGGPQQSGIPNGHHPMPPQQTSSMGQEDQQQMSAPAEGGVDPYRHQQIAGQMNNQQPMGGPGYQQRHPYYGPRMPPPPGGQRPQFHPQQTPNSGPPQQQQPMRMPHPQSSFSSPMYRDTGYPNSQPAGMGSTGSSHPAGYPSPMDNQANRMGPVTSMYSQNSAAPGANSQQISAGNNMGQPMQQHQNHSPMPRYSQRPGYQTPTRGALSAMLSNSAASADPRTPSGPQWRQRAPMAPPGYTPSSGGEPMSRRQLPMMRNAAPPKKPVVDFPPDSVEATKINKINRRVLLNKDIAKTDPRKLVMCLRSGLLCECIWALDTLTILLHDDHSIARFDLAKMPGLLDILLAHFKQSLALMFVELSDLIEIDPQTYSHSLDHDDHDLESKQVMLQKTNYSWTARNGMKVIIDSDLKKGHMIPSPSMYSRNPYASRYTDHIVVSTYESEDTNEMYVKQFRRHIKPDKKYEEDTSSTPVPSEDVLKEDDNTTMNSPAPTSPTSGGTEFSAQSTQSEKRLLPDGGIAQFPLCNGCMSDDIKAEASNHSCESSDVVLTKTPESTVEPSASSTIKRESSIDQKVAESSQDLEVLEAKLSLSRKRRFSETIDIEPIVRDESALESDVDRRLEEIAIRCVTIANILRGLSFVPANEKLMAENGEMLGVFGRLLNLRLHVDSAKDKRCWWWSSIEALREHTLVTISNVSGHIQLIGMSHEVCFPLLDSLLFWSTTTAAYARDPLPRSHSLSIRNLVLEILCKMCAHSENMNLLLATPPYDRITLLFQSLAKLLSEPDQVRREFALVIVSCLAQADGFAARGLAVQPSCVSQLISILESAESAAYSIAQQQGVGALRQNPEAMGTSLDMIRRTSATLVEMAQVEENHSILLRQQDRLLNLVMSQILDQHVAKMLSDVLYECTKDSKVDIEPSYVISSKTEVDSQGEELMEEDNSSVNEESDTKQTHNITKTVIAAEIKHEPELGKENINKPILESNSTMGMISAAS